MAVKETQDFVELLTVLADAITEAKEDGVVDWKDLPKLLPVIGAMRTALAGADQITAELKEIAESPALANLFLQQTFDATLKIVRAVLK